VIVIEPANDALAFMRIYNADGGEVGACGNAARCIGALLLDEAGTRQGVLRTASGPLTVERGKGSEVWVDMGPARFDWREIPLSRPQDTLHLNLRVETSAGPLADAVALSMGNPHVIFFVADAFAFDLATIGPRLERDPLFPERVNVTLAQILSRGRIRARVWERGAGLTLACGTAACAMAVAAHRRGLVDRRVDVVLPGGELAIEWRSDGHVAMSGPFATAFRGSVDPERLAGRR
jgi:diaminopimelate epimerase